MSEFEHVKDEYTYDHTHPHERHITLFGRDLKITKAQLITITLLCLFFFITSSYYSLVRLINVIFGANKFNFFDLICI